MSDGVKGRVYFVIDEGTFEGRKKTWDTFGGCTIGYLRRPSSEQAGKEVVEVMFNNHTVATLFRINFDGLYIEPK